jgi:hypothetical protein
MTHSRLLDRARGCWSTLHTPTSISHEEFDALVEAVAEGCCEGIGVYEDRLTMSISGLRELQLINLQFKTERDAMAFAEVVGLLAPVE